MHSQPAVILKRKGSTFAFMGIFARPYLHLTDNQVTVYRGVFSAPVHYSLMDIHSAHTNHPETYIELIGRNPSDSVRIDLHPLDEADRVRFIFLVESSINRKFSHKHSPAVQAMV